MGNQQHSAKADTQKSAPIGKAGKRRKAPSVEEAAREIVATREKVLKELAKH